MKFSGLKKSVLATVLIFSTTNAFAFSYTMQLYFDAKYGKINVEQLQSSVQAMDTDLKSAELIGAISKDLALDIPSTKQMILNHPEAPALQRLIKSYNSSIEDMSVDPK